MAVGIRCGVLVGANVSPSIGIMNPTSGASNPMTGVSRDSGSGIYVPANAAQWTTTLGVAIPGKANPISMWGTQEAATPFADAIGANSLAVAGTAPLFNQAVPGWTRTGFGQGGNNNHAWGTLGSPNASSTSVALLAYCYSNTSMAARGMIQISASGTRCLMLLTTGKPVIDCAAVTATAVNNHIGAVHPWLLVYDRTGSRVMFYSDLEKLSGTYSAAVTSGQSGFGANGTQSGNTTAVELYGAEWSGADAEFTDAQAKSLLQTLGWTIPWS